MVEPTGYQGYQGYGSYDALDFQRKLMLQRAAARARQGFPKTTGEGIASVGQSIGDVLEQRRLEARDRAYQEMLQKQAGAAPIPGTGPAPPAAPAGARPPPGTSTALPPLPGTDTVAEGLPDTSRTLEAGTPDENRNGITAALLGYDPSFTAASEPAGAPTPDAQPAGPVPLPPPRPVYDRNRYVQELQDRPELIPQAAAMVQGEVGPNASPEQKRIQLATLFDRATARGTDAAREIETNTGPGSRGYYPRQTFQRGTGDLDAFQRDILAPILRGEDPGGRALGFSPTGNASGGVAARGIASGRYGNAGRLGDETYVTQERPQQLAQLTATRVPGTMTDIRPAPPAPAPPAFSVAEGMPGGRPPVDASVLSPPLPTMPPAGNAPGTPPTLAPGIRPAPAAGPGFAGAVPGPMAKLPPEPGPPSVGRTTQALQPLPPRPKPPIMDQTPTAEEVHGMRMMMAAPTDPNIKAIATPYIQYGQQKRAAEFAQKQEQYKADEASWIKEFEMRKTRELDAPEIEGKLREQELKLANMEQTRQELARRGGVTPEQAFTVIKESHKDVASIPGEVAAIRNAQRVLPDAITGLGAEAKVNILRVLAAAGQPVDPSISATQQFQSYVKGVYGRLRPQVIGAGPQANAEGKVLEKAAAGDISMDPDAIKAVLNSIYALNVIAAKEHQNKIAVYTNTNPNAQQYAYGTFGLKMEDIVPDTAVRVLRQHFKENPSEAIKEFNTDFRTPGLAQKILGLGD